MNFYYRGKFKPVSVCQDVNYNLDHFKIARNRFSEKIILKQLIREMIQRSLQANTTVIYFEFVSN